MANTVEIKGSRRLEAILREAPKALFDSMAGVGRKMGDRFTAAHRKARLRAPPNVSGRPRPVGEGIRATDQVKGREGRGLLKTMRTLVSGRNLATLTTKVYTRNIIAIQHQLGRTLYPHRGTSMAIPLRSALGAGGKVKPSIAKLRSSRKLILIRARNGKRFLAKIATRYERKKGAARLIFLFHLVKKIQLRPRFGLYETWRTWAKDTGKALWEGGLKRAMATARAKAPRN